MAGRPADRLPKPEARSPAEQAAIGTEAMVVRVPLIEGTGGQAGRRHVSKGVPGKIAGPWDIDGIWVIQSGSHFATLLSSGVSNTGANVAGGTCDRPNRNATGNLSTGQAIDRWF